MKGNVSVYTLFFVRNMFIRNMRLKMGKNREKFKKHRQAEFQITTYKSCSTGKAFSKLARN